MLQIKHNMGQKNVVKGAWTFATWGITVDFRSAYYGDEAVTDKFDINMIMRESMKQLWSYPTRYL